MLYIVFTIVS